MKTFILGAVLLAACSSLAKDSKVKIKENEIAKTISLAFCKAEAGVKFDDFIQSYLESQIMMMTPEALASFKKEQKSRLEQFAKPVFAALSAKGLSRDKIKEVVEDLDAKAKLLLATSTQIRQKENCKLSAKARDHLDDLIFSILYYYAFQSVH